MAKDRAYYESVDLGQLASIAARNKVDRKRDKTWGEICKVLAIRSDILGRRIPQEDLLTLLGEPDRTKCTDAGEVWEYDWFGQHGPTEYRSTTPFLIVNGVLVGLAQRKE